MDYYSTSSFKLEGRRALNNKWQTALLVCFVPQVISLLLNMFSIMGQRSGVFVFRQVTIQGIIFQTNIPLNAGATVWTVVVLLISLLLLPSLTIGICSYFMAIHRGENPSWTKVFSQLTYWWRNVRLTFAEGLVVALGLLLFIVPGIVASIGYALTYYLVVDTPQMGVVETMGTSRQLMRGKKMFYFILGLSFFGWSLLIGFADFFIGASVLGLVIITIGNLFLQVYFQSTIAAFYVYVKA